MGEVYLKVQKFNHVLILDCSYLLVAKWELIE